jgi:tetratricopeptide (TPR) repeat protein
VAVPEHTSRFNVEFNSCWKLENYVANVLFENGYYEDAIEWYQRALSGREKTLGQGHTDALITIKNIANVLCKPSEYSKALD